MLYLDDHFVKIGVFYIFSTYFFFLYLCIFFVLYDNVLLFIFSAVMHLLVVFLNFPLIIS